MTPAATPPAIHHRRRPRVAAAMTDNRGLMWVSYLALSMELLGIYFKTFGTLLDTSLFFVSAGLLVIGLAWVAWKLHQRAPVVVGGPS